jgi:hypothetical protein
MDGDWFEDYARIVMDSGLRLEDLTVLEGIFEPEAPDHPILVTLLVKAKSDASRSRSYRVDKDGSWQQDFQDDISAGVFG